MFFEYFICVIRDIKNLHNTFCDQPSYLDDIMQFFFFFFGRHCSIVRERTKWQNLYVDFNNIAYTVLFCSFVQYTDTARITGSNYEISGTQDLKK
jgi:hypothetical protein